MNKISPLQLFALMICGRSFTMMTYFPITNTNAQIMMIGTLLSTLIQAVMVYPVVKFQKLFPNDNVCTLVMSKNKKTGMAVTVIYALFFLLISYMIIGNFTYFFDYYFADYIPRIITVATCTAAAVYLAHANVKVIGKTSVVVGAMFLIMTIIVIASSFQKFNMKNFNLAVENIPQSLWESVVAEFRRNRDLIVMVFLLPDLKGDVGKTAGWYFVVKLVLFEIVFGFVTIILGDYGVVSNLSFFSLASYSKTKVMERYDALFMALWSLMALVKLGCYLHCAGKCLKLIVPKLNIISSVLIMGAVSAGASLYYLIPHKWNEVVNYEGSALGIILLYTVIPLLCIVLWGREVRNERRKQKIETA